MQKSFAMLSIIFTGSNVSLLKPCLSHMNVYKEIIFHPFTSITNILFGILNTFIKKSSHKMKSI